MFKNYLVVALRSLMRQRVFSMINVFGLALGVACCVLIMLFIEHEYAFDQFHERKNRLYRSLIVEVRPNGVCNGCVIN